MTKRLIGVLLLIALSAFAQQPDTTKVKKPWTHSLAGGLNLTQISFNDNWSQGGENALAYAINLLGKSANDLPKANWTTSYKFAFGQTKLGGSSIRKTDDKIDLETMFTYKLGTYVNPYVAATLKTQFAKGFDYSTNPKTAVSKFFDPGYLTQSVGLGYQPIPQIKTRLGAALREVMTSEFVGYSDDPQTTKIEKSKVEGGLESVTEVNWQLQSNLLFTGKVELFDPFKDLEKVVVRSDNTLAAKISKYVSVNFNVQVIKEPEEKVSQGKTQVKQTLAIGLSYTFL
ncbi:MAG: DUF3078 domain-containing protein [bacterium]